MNPAPRVGAIRFTPAPFDAHLAPSRSLPLVATRRVGPPAACSLGEREPVARGRVLAPDRYAHGQRVDDSDRDAGSIAVPATERSCCSFPPDEPVVELGLGSPWLRPRGPKGTKGCACRASAAPHPAVSRDRGSGTTGRPERR